MASASLARFTRIVVLAAGAAPPGTAAAQAATAKPIRARFSGSAGRTGTAVFTIRAQSRVALMLCDGRKLSLPQAMSGSGARCCANSDASFVFWNKGNTAIIEAIAKTTYSDCTTKSSQ